ncbi:hypothetical protein F0562_006937 [Nyssa sinensis]|uniref:NB-ARC domain-containing protein n=1 Tax=Nyssa sinensis TaxID=561372 RepID=A0A5J5A4B1_9ASTE|nr:hypothetical protein F0562_006937 [Nyssa sinensis]
MKEEIVYNCGGLPLAAMTLAEVISIQMAKNEGFWPHPSVYKGIHLGLHVYDVEDLKEAIEKLRLIPGVDHIKIEEGLLVISPTYKSYIFVRGECDAEEIVKQLRKFCFTELFAVYNLSP